MLLLITSQTKKLVLSFMAGILSTWISFYIGDYYYRSGSLKQVSNDFIKLHKWSKSIPSLYEEDQRRLDTLMNKRVNPTQDEVRDQLYKVANMPLQTFCTVGKYFGGEWLGQCGALDGNKYVCLDKLYRDVINNRCLIYSFGISTDWSFEFAMAQLGCTVRAFDPTIDGKKKPDTNLISFERIGLRDKSGNVEGLGEALTLQDIVKKMGDFGKRISYLKADIEGSELKALPEWISSGIISSIDQFGLEIHTAPSVVRNIVEDLSQLLDVFRKLNQLGFRLISATNNDCVGKSQDFQGKYLNYFEVVFLRE